MPARTVPGRQEPMKRIDAAKPAASVSRRDKHWAEQPWDFLRRAVSLAQRGLPLGDFLQETCALLNSVSGFDSVEVQARDHEREVLCRCARDATGRFTTSLSYSSKDRNSHAGGLRKLYQQLKGGQPGIPGALHASSGAVWVQSRLLDDSYRKGLEEAAGRYRSLVFLPFRSEPEGEGLLLLKDRTRRRFDELSLCRLEMLAESLGISLSIRKAQAALGERIKELTCLYRMALLVEEPGARFGDIMQGIVGLVPDAFLYPGEASARIELDGSQYQSAAFQAAGESLKTDIVVLGVCRGTLEVAYRTPKPVLDHGPFLREEKTLLETVGREIALLVERKQRETESRELEEQLRHADRLATIGELAAGFAHELNEPLANVLGFAQLASKESPLPAQARQDIDKIVLSALHARGLTQQLLLFARRMPQKRKPIDLNGVVTEALNLLQPLFVQEKVEVARRLSSRPVSVHADDSQIRQVLVNLTVNAVQAMAKGGRLTISTTADPGQGTATLALEDTGTGMTEEVLGKIFLPFFTTKEAGRGTGLGLSVVHGIVTSHGGRIEVSSQEGIGTCFRVFLPLDKEVQP
jgi:two-component system, NtrC family, sensor kinase